jgi:hypothetical protein
MVMMEAIVSFICLTTLIVILLEARRSGGFRRKWPIAVWAATLLALALLGLLRVLVNRDDWSDARVLLGLLGASNFLFGAALLVRWLFWTPPTAK